MLCCSRPSKLYRYSNRDRLQRSLRLGKFRLAPATGYKDLSTDAARQDDELVRLRLMEPEQVIITHAATFRKIDVLGPVTFRTEIHSDYLVLCFAQVWSKHLCSAFSDADAYLVIHEVEQFAERLHHAVESILPDWTGIDGAVTYGGRSLLGAVYSKPARLSEQQEWRFAWRPPRRTSALQPVFVRVGNIEQLAELKQKDGAEIN